MNISRYSVWNSPHRMIKTKPVSLSRRLCFFGFSFEFFDSCFYALKLFFQVFLGLF